MVHFAFNYNQAGEDSTLLFVMINIENKKGTQWVNRGLTTIKKTTLIQCL